MLRKPVDESDLLKLKLHIPAGRRVLAKHKGVRTISIADAHDAIRRAAASPSPEGAPMVAELEQVTGLRIADLAKLARERWQPP